MARLDTQQRRILSLLSETEWRRTEFIAAQTSLYRSINGVGRVLGKFAHDGLVERRTVRAGTPSGDASEWRLLPESAID